MSVQEIQLPFNMKNEKKITKHHYMFKMPSFYLAWHDEMFWLLFLLSSNVWFSWGHGVLLTNNKN